MLACILENHQNAHTCTCNQKAYLAVTCNSYSYKLENVAGLEEMLLHIQVHVHVCMGEVTLKLKPSLLSYIMYMYMYISGLLPFVTGVMISIYFVQK